MFFRTDTGQISHKFIDLFQSSKTVKIS